MILQHDYNRAPVIRREDGEVSVLDEPMTGALITRVFLRIRVNKLHQPGLRRLPPRRVRSDGGKLGASGGLPGSRL